MGYSSAKVYSDGSHYIAIPKETQPWKKRKASTPKQVLNDEQQQRNLLFEQAYKDTADQKKQERKFAIDQQLQKIIPNDTERNEFVEQELQRMQRNKDVRKTRLYRKISLQDWDYFATFTYDGAKLTEDEFHKKLSNTLKKLVYRKGWKYVGVWERSPEHNRLHFHAILCAPNMVGEFETVKDYNTRDNRRQTTNQNTYFRDRFGRNDFKEICPQELGSAVAYMVKYIEKTGERLVYSRNLPTFFLSDIADEDVVCAIGAENRKLLLFDDFTCMVEGELMGKVSHEVIAKMPKSN